MAAHSTNFIRVRLHFDYPPPAVIVCRMCWLLVDLNTCRVVADLESIIRDKFDFSRGSILSLFIEDCYLPHTESIYVVRDNDSVRVKVDCLAQVNGTSSCPDQLSENYRKRQKPTEEDSSKNEVSVDWKKKKRRKGSEESVERNAKPASDDERSEKSQGKCRKKKKKRKNGEEKDTTVTTKPAASTKKTPFRVEEPVKSKTKPPVTQKVSSSDSSSRSSKEEEAPKTTAAKTPAPKTPSSTPASSKAHPTTKPSQTKQHTPSSSSSETSSDEATSVKILSQHKPMKTPAPKRKTSDETATSALQPTNCAQKQAASVAAPPRDNTEKPCSSSSEEEIRLVIRRPAHQPGQGVESLLSGRGRGRGRSWSCGPGEGGRREGRVGIRGHSGSSEFGYNGAMEPSYQRDSLTNVSVVLENAAERAPKQDYSAMPLLAAPPPVGQKIAFKLLELTENYTPEVSDYKEGKIVSFDHATNQIELEVQNAAQAPVEPGKFDLVYQNPDGSERVEYAVTRGSLVTERWDSLLEPRLII